MVVVGGFVAVATFLFLFWASRWQVRGLLYQAVVALGAGAASALLVPLPRLLLWHQITLSDGSLIAAAATPLAVLCGGLAAALGRRDRLLRLATRVGAADIRRGFVRLQGETAAPQGAVYSIAGRIPGIYIREVTHRYEPHADGRFDRARRSLPHHWIKTYDRTTTADFRLTDTAGAVMDVIADRGEFHPLRVARFYNDVPVETFFDKAYSGDTRTEVYFIPVTANVTVWGRRYRSSSPLPGDASERLGYDAAKGGLIIVEETPSRAYTGRWQLSFLLLLSATVLAGLVACAVFAPDALPFRILPR
jgi:hypothetical protein